jgi:RNA polymerase sigma-70 factor, ECF subfamily
MSQARWSWIDKWRRDRDMFEDIRPNDSVEAPNIGADDARASANDRLQRLLVDTGRGDKRAFEQLYSLTSRCLMGRALSILRDRDAAEDVLQEAYVRIWAGAGKFDTNRGHALGWMIRVLRNTAIDRLRRDRVQARYVLFVDELPDAPAASDAIEDRLTLTAALGALSPEHLNIISRVVVQGWTHNEVSLQDGVPTPTTKARAQRGLKRLRTALTQDMSTTMTLSQGRAAMA